MNPRLAHLFMICSNIRLTKPTESIGIDAQAIHEWNQRDSAVGFNRHCERSEATHPTTARKRKNGLLRGACHRARIRATRWLAMTKRSHHSAAERRRTLSAISAGTGAAHGAP